MTWSRPPVPVPVLELPRATRVVIRWDSCLVELSDNRSIVVPFDYTQRMDDASLEAQQRVVVTQWGMLLIWPDLPFRVTVRRLLMDAKAGRAPWGDPPTVIP